MSDNKLKTTIYHILYGISPSYHIGVQNKRDLIEIKENEYIREKTLEELSRKTDILLGSNYVCTKEFGNKNESDYISMQKNQYEDTRVSSADVVGQYKWHENFPYETFLLYKYGDVRYPVFADTHDKVALDFACGPGRMVRRMRKLFKEVDGCDIAQRLLDEAKENVPGSAFYLTNGNDLGDVPNNHYDFIYCTISMQHIASHTIRMQIIGKMVEALKDDGCITLQMAYDPDFPYTYKISESIINDVKIMSKGKMNQAGWMDDDFNAEFTNGAHDVGIGKADLPVIKNELLNLFGEVDFWFANVSDYYDDLRGEKHCDYWAKSWIFIHCAKPKK